MQKCKQNQMILATQPVGTNFPEVSWLVAMTSHNQLVSSRGFVSAGSRSQSPNLWSVSTAFVSLLCKSVVGINSSSEVILNS